VAPSSVVEIFNVISHLHAQFNYGGPCFTVEKFGLQSSPERFDHGIVIALNRLGFSAVFMCVTSRVGMSGLQRSS